MIEVLEKVKQAYDKSTTQIDRIIVDKNPYRITNADYNDDCYENGNIFGTAIARMLEFEIENSINLEKKEFEYQTGIYIDDKIFWISLGNFIVQDVEPNNTTNKNKVTSMDYMLKSNIKYNSKLDYKSGKITMLDVVKEGCQQSGLELATTDFANNDFIVDSNQFSEDTLIRQVFQAAAQMSGTFAKIRSDNKLYFITPKRKGLLVKEVHKMTVAELNKLPVEKLAACENNYSLSSYKELIVKRNTHPINLVSLGMSDVEGENITLRDEESIAKDGENSLVINDNPFAYTQEKREQLITALFNVVKGFEYTAFEITGQAKPYIETGDEVVAKDKEGNLNHSFLFRFRYKSPNGLESEMSAPSITKATVDYQNVPNAIDIAKRTELIVDKQNQTITGLIKQQSDTDSRLVTAEQSIDGFKDTVSSIQDVTNTIEGNKTITLENCVEGSLLELHIFGNNTVFDSLYPADDLYPSDDLYPKGDSRIEVTNENNETNIYELGVKEVLRNNGDTRDEYILQDGKAKVIRRISNTGTELSKETVEDLGEFYISLSKGTNTITIKNYSATLRATFAIINDFTDVFATRVEMNSSITETAEEINLEVRKKVDENEIISKINMSAEDIGIEAKKININGVVSANGNFEVDTEGNVSMAGNIYMTGTNTKIIGGDGMMTNLQYFSSGLVGHDFINTGAEANQGYDQKIGIALLINIPSNFKIKNAKLKLKNSEIKYQTWDGRSSSYGNCSNISCSKEYSIGHTWQGGTTSIVNIDLPSFQGEKIADLGSFVNNQEREIDITNFLSQGMQYIVIGDYANVAKDYNDGWSKTGYIDAFVDCFGYIKY